METELWKKTCAFTGHRPQWLPWGEQESDPRCLALKERLFQAVLTAYNNGFRHFICGMALGCDVYFGEAVLRLKKLHPRSVTLEAAIPYPEQAKNWSGAQQLRYRRLLEQCDVETVVQQFYSKSCMMRRNQYMVDHAARLIAVYNGKCRGGTYATINYALDQQRETDIIYL